MSAVNRPMSRMRKLETKEALFRARKRILKYMVQGYLKQEGYLQAAETFASEAALTGEYEVCDNIDLDIILQILCTLSFLANGSYQKIIAKNVDTYVSQSSASRAIQQVVNALNNINIINKYIRFPQNYNERQVLKERFYETFKIPGVLGCIDGTLVSIIRPKKHEERYYCRKGYHARNVLIDYCSYYLMRFNKPPQFCRKVEERPPTRPRRPQTRKTKPECVETFEKEDVDLPGSFTVTKLFKDDQDDNDNTPAVERVSLAGFLAHATPDKREIVELLYQDIVRPSGVTWDDVKGLATAKNLLMESVVYPVRYPEMFTGLLEPWRGVLLHGPPGTGKTLLARAVASESCCTFFNISCSTIVNKWRGESEKIVKVLFDMASHYSPSIIFIDEVETLASDRSAAGEHEASRRLKTQLLTELDGISQREGIVFLLANTNMPWDIDPAMLRRLEKRIYIPLPDLNTRTELFEKLLSSKTIEVYPKIDFKELAAKTEGYSGSDIKLVCKEALMSTVRKLLPNMVGKSCNVNRKDRLDLCDVLTAIEKTKPVSKNLAKRHVDWQNEMGCS